MSNCVGCGIKLQSDDPLLSGYTPDINKDYCQRCFRLTNYNDYKEADLVLNNDELINRINNANKYTLFLVDYFNINSDTINIYNKISNPKSFVITKIDVIPRSISLDRVSKYIKDIYSIKEDIFFLSALKSKNVTNIINYINKNNIKEVVMCGLTNTGKSSLINAISSLFNGNKSLTTSVIPNTTLDFVKVTISPDLIIYDTPGFLGPKLDFSYIKKINTKSFIKPVTYQLKENDIIRIEDILYIKSISNNKNSLTIYASNNLTFDKIYKLDNQESIIIDISKNTDILFKGVGIINVKKEGKFEIFGRTDLIELRSSLFRSDD